MRFSSGTLFAMRALLILTAVAGTLLPAQEREPQSRPTIIRATGEATASVRPDQTRLRLAVISTAGTADHARAKSAEQTAEVLARLREFLGQDADIRTANYLLNKSYSEGYVAKNTIEIRVLDPATTGKVVDVATKAGASECPGSGGSSGPTDRARSVGGNIARACCDGDAHG
jgi:uncharacterized protein YggE